MAKQKLRIEEGKYYKAAGGYKTGPMQPSGDDEYPWISDGCDYYTDDGFMAIDDHLIAEWNEEGFYAEQIAHLEKQIADLEAQKGRLSALLAESLSR